MADTVLCPNCSKEIESSFGPKTCPHCGTLVFVSFDGSVELPAESPAATARAGASPQSFESLPSPAVAHSEPVESFEPVAADLPSDAFGYEPQGAQGSQGDQLTAVAASARSLQANSELDSIQAFANSEFSDGHEGDLLFDLLIEGLDTETLRRDFKDSISDERLKIDVDAVMRKIRDGKLRMPSVSAVKASVLVRRLKELPIEVSWVQRRLIDADPGLKESGETT